MLEQYQLNNKLHIIILISLLIKCWPLYYSINHGPICRFYFYCYGFIVYCYISARNARSCAKKIQWHSCTLYFIKNIVTSTLQFLQLFYILELEQSIFCYRLYSVFTFIIQIKKNNFKVCWKIVCYRYFHCPYAFMVIFLFILITKVPNIDFKDVLILSIWIIY